MRLAGRWPIAASLASLALACAGCSSNFDPETLLNSARLLAIKAEPPEIGDGETTHLTALTYAVAGPIEWDFCTLGPGATGNDLVNPRCVTGESDGDPRVLSPIGAGPECDFTMPAITADNLGLPDATSGVYVTLRFTGHGLDADGMLTTVRGAYRLRYHAAIDPRPPNHNPSLEDQLLLDGKDIFVGAPTLLPGGTTSGLAAHVDPGSNEPYLLYTGEERLEAVSLSWYASGGVLSFDGGGGEGDAVQLSLTQHASSGDVIDLYVVARDGRGGEDFVHREVRVK